MRSTRTRRLVAAAVLLTVSGAGLYAEAGSEEDVRQHKRFGLGVQALGPTVIASGYVDYFFGPRFNAELGAGLFGIYVGGKYYFTAPNPEARWFPYAGAIFFVVPQFMSSDNAIGGYLPAGVQFIARWGLTLSGEVAVMFSTTGYLSPYGALKAGFRL